MLWGYAGRKLERPKAQIELNLGTAVKDNKKCFYKYIINNRRAKENLCLLLDVKGSDKGKEKTEVLNAFLLVFITTSGCWGTKCPELEDRGGEQNGAPMI